MYKGLLSAERRKIDFLFGNVDRIEYLSYRNVVDNLSCKTDLSKSLLKTFAPYLISIEEGQSWNMQGKIFTFKASEAIRDYYKENCCAGVSIGGFLFADEDREKFLENPAYYAGRKKLLSFCSHEGYENNDKAFEAEMEKAYITEAKRDELYLEISANVKAMSSDAHKKRKKILTVLADAENYFAEARNDYIYACPKYECGYGDFLAAAETVLTKDLITALNACGGFLEASEIFHSIKEKYKAELCYFRLAIESESVKQFRA